MSNGSAIESFSEALDQLTDLPDYICETDKSKRSWVEDEFDRIAALRQKGYPFSVIAQKINALMGEDGGISEGTLRRHFNDISGKRKPKRSRRKPARNVRRKQKNTKPKAVEPQPQAPPVWMDEDIDPTSIKAPPPFVVAELIEE